MKKSYSLKEIFQEMELALIASMKRNLWRHEDEELKEGFKFEQWQSAKLRDLERLRRENWDIVESYTPEIEKVVKNSIRQSFKRAKERTMGFLRRFILRRDNDPDLITPQPMEPIIDALKGDNLKKAISEDDTVREAWENALPEKEKSFFVTNDRLLNEMVKTVNNDLRIAEHTVMRKTEDIYRQTIFKAQTFYNTGTYTMTQALDLAINDFLEQGVATITYKNGRVVGIDSYAEMALRTGRHRAFLSAEGEKRKKLGVSTILVTSHATSCPLCLPWQNKVLIDDIYSGGTAEDGDYQLLSTAVKAGLLHPNCEHNLNTYYQGITFKPKDQDEEQALSNYEARQQQRALERQIRREKRLIAGAFEEGTKRAHEAKLRRLNSKMIKHLRENPQRRRKPERERLRVKQLPTQEPVAK